MKKRKNRLVGSKMERYVESNQIAVNLKMSLDCGVFESVH